MEKIFSVSFSALFLVSFLAVLFVPITVSARPNCGSSCSNPVSAECVCAVSGTSGAIAREGQDYCYNGNIYYTRDSCLAAMSAGGTGVTSVSDLEALIVKIGGYISTLLFAVAGVMLIIAGFMWMASGGNPEGATKARTMLINALIGVAIALAARGGVALIQSIIP